MKKYNLKMIASILISLTTIAMQTCRAETLIGKVTKAQTAVPGMEIKLSHSNPTIANNLSTAFTDKNGVYSFTNLPEVVGEYNLKYYWAGTLIRTKKVDSNDLSEIIEEMFE